MGIVNYDEIIQKLSDEIPKLVEQLGILKSRLNHDFIETDAGDIETMQQKIKEIKDKLQDSLFTFNEKIGDMKTTENDFSILRGGV